MLDTLPTCLAIAFVAIAFPLMLAMQSTLDAVASGHRRYLRCFPPTRDRLLASWHFAPVPQFGRRRHFFVGIGERGLHLAPCVLQRPPWMWGVPCIPWSEVVVVDCRQVLFTWVAEVNIAGDRWCFGGGVARALAKRRR